MIPSEVWKDHWITWWESHRLVGWEINVPV